MKSVSTDRSKMVPLSGFFFVCASVVLYRGSFGHYFFIISLSFRASGRLCFMIVALPGNVHLRFVQKSF